MAFDLLGLSPLVILLVIVGIFIFLKVMKYAILIAIIAIVYLAWQLNLIPGLPA
ncbi:MAG TPA: hypothetical protein VGR28_03070 [Candidatus Thermoplasmatota archaeon]|jgi:hypothetical protein|nr:hypothetical protein [Candidatus Thermoplasmatota archaeon]